MVAQLIKNLLANVGDTRDTGMIPGSGRSSGEGNGNLLQYSCLENSMDRGVHGVTKSRARTMIALFLIFEGTSTLFSIVAVPIYIPTDHEGGSLFSHTLSSICL